MKFSVLLPVYSGDQPSWLREAFKSVTTDQTLAPSQVVLVRDGPVGGDLQRTIDDLVTNSQIPVEYVPLERNVRLARALEEGLKRCDYDLVARIDADDICLPERFAVQIPMMKNLDLLGSAVTEFSQATDTEELNLKHVRSRPQKQDEIWQYAPFHNPFNHPTVVFRKSAVERAGGYQDMPFMEDYWLFLRMLKTGARAGNVAEPLILYRVDSRLFHRRGGWQALRSDWIFQRRIRRLGITTRRQCLRNLVQRTIYRIIPGRLRAWAYERYVRGPHEESK